MTRRLPGFEHHHDDDDCKDLTFMVVVAQMAGLAISSVALAFLNMPPRLSFWAYAFIALGVAMLIIGLLWCWWDALGNRFDRAATGARKRSQQKYDSLPAARRKMRIVKSTLLLVVGDTFLLLVLIRMTGGLGHSPLDPLLPVIPVIAIILKQPRRTVMGALILQVAVTAIAVIHWEWHQYGISHSVKWLIDWRGHDSSSDPGYIRAFATVAGGSIALSIFEYLRTHAKSPILLSLRELRNIKLPVKTIRENIEKGAKHWTNWLDWRMLPVDDLSLVHKPKVIAVQAAMLSLPYWIGTDQELASSITQRITFLTYAAHWIDDHFDPVQHRSVNHQDPNSVIESQATLSGLIVHMEKTATTPPGLWEHLLQRLPRFVHKPVAANADTQVMRAVKRIMFGGFIQNAATDQQLRDLLARYVSFVQKGSSTEIQEAYGVLLRYKRPMAVWMSAKVVMELLDCCSPAFSATESEYLNLLYGPILFYQDIHDEIALEHFGKAFGNSEEEIKQHLPDEETCLYVINNVCDSLFPIVYPDGRLPDGRCAQLELLLTTYQKVLPEVLTAAYREFLKKRHDRVEPVGAQSAGA